MELLCYLTNYKISALTQEKKCYLCNYNKKSKGLLSDPSGVYKSRNKSDIHEALKNRNNGAFISSM